MNIHAREMCGVGTYFEEPLDDDVPTNDDRRIPDSDVEENSDDDDSYDNSDEGDGCLKKGFECKGSSLETVFADMGICGSGKKNFTELSKSPHGHSKKVHPKKFGRNSSRYLSVPVFIQTIRILTKKKAELDSRIRRLETKKNELQSLLKKELDRRSSYWSLKLDKYKIKQHRLREWARELIEQNVSLQKEVSSFNKKEEDNRIKISFLEKHLEDLSKRIEKVSEENQNIRKQLTQLQAKNRVAQDNKDYVQENYQEKVKELKSETLLTAVLREKLYSEEMDINKLQANLVATVRGNDILKYEVKNTLDALSYATPKFKYLELQVLKMDKNTNQLTNDLQECIKELGIVKAILPKVFQFMWEEVKSYSEMNILLNYEINILKRKVFRPEVALEVHQISTCGAVENVGTAAKTNGIMHEPVRANRPNEFCNNSSSVLCFIHTIVDIPSQIAGPSTFDLLNHALVGPGREEMDRVVAENVFNRKRIRALHLGLQYVGSLVVLLVYSIMYGLTAKESNWVGATTSAAMIILARRDTLQSTVICLREGFRREDQNSSVSSSEGCGSSVKYSCSADAGYLGNETMPCTADVDFKAKAVILVYPLLQANRYWTRIWHLYFKKVHQKSTCGACENVGTATKPNGIMHLFSLAYKYQPKILSLHNQPSFLTLETDRATIANVFNLKGIRYFGNCISYVVVASMLLGADVSRHLSVKYPLAARRDALQSIVILRREDFHRKDHNSSISSSEGCGSSVKRSSSADAGHLSLFLF
ncbi:hypothetical protein CQW23_18520 [Capsicum baccatum]|uniref:Uncharacterized protein n=1 Tax=Capsicum baccatum TaxID=33114 RepID=A0A2G2W353_CAPBA|nr:hypothetical protein CQW23_18520 [Capsicum baccatum]